MNVADLFEMAPCDNCELRPVIVTHLPAAVKLPAGRRSNGSNHSNTVPASGTGSVNVTGSIKFGL
jgi:hypothetical protein